MNVSSQPIKVAIVEDRYDTRQALFYLINGSDGFGCVAACASAEEAIEKLPGLCPDVVLMDIELPGMSGIHCLPRLKELLPRVQIMMLTVFENADKIFGALAAGAKGYVVKKTPPTELLRAIREMHEGGAPMSSQVARRVVDAFERPALAIEPEAQLTKREREVLEHLARGLLYKEIAAQLSISIGTLRGHISSIYDKLQVHNRTEALLKVLPMGRD